MRIAVLGDIHANLPALEAVLRVAGEERCERILHTGDLIGYGPHPNETIDLVRARSIDGVRGHFDENAAWLAEPSGAAGDPIDVAIADRTHLWTVRRLGFEQRSFLKSLPFSLDRRIDGRVVSLFHASPTDLCTGIDETASESALRQIVEETGAEILLFGHTHRSWHRAVEGAHFVNAGSVGCASDGDPRSGLAIVDLGGRVTVEFRRVPYDVDRAARDAQAAGLPPEIADEIRAGTCPATGPAALERTAVPSSHR